MSGDQLVLPLTNYDKILGMTVLSILNRKVRFKNVRTGRLKTGTVHSMTFGIECIKLYCSDKRYNTYTCVVYKNGDTSKVEFL